MKKPLVVVIDDVDDTLELIKYNFSKQGMEVVSFVSPLIALNFIQKSQPSIIISDWMMPEIEGPELLKILKKDPLTANIPFIMLTCKNNNKDWQYAIQNGAIDFIVKPVRMAKLIARIEEILYLGGSNNPNFNYAS
jgi:response regulator RpfG family c-di-GMP phosphodiesterase